MKLVRLILWQGIFFIVVLACVYINAYGNSNLTGFSSESVNVIPVSSNEVKHSDKQEKPKMALRGKVLHTDQWDANRLSFNRQCKKLGKLQSLRADDEFWSGEKFILEADATGKILPDTVFVTIQGTGYSTILRKDGKGWSGSLFDKSMIGRWGNREKEDLVFIFSANIDGSRVEALVTISVNNIEKYWVMHRKE